MILCLFIFSIISTLDSVHLKLRVRSRSSNQRHLDIGTTDSCNKTEDENDLHHSLNLLNNYKNQLFELFQNYEQIMKNITLIFTI